ncbi:hypothetical protein GQ600_7354 [Phytophthora cactorum]|nr:hypothetical protein GQ600_7354 [Phytophthora cactorum]
MSEGRNMDTLAHKSSSLPAHFTFCSPQPTTMAPNAVPDTREEVCTDIGSVTCQICLEELTSKDQIIVTHLCSTTCPAVFCLQQWIRCLDTDAATTEHLIERYTRLCEASCNFTCPGCHNAQYTQLPAFYQNACRDFANAVALTLRPSEKTRIPELRRVHTCACEEEDKDVISDEDIIECRNCRVMIVKVDGCSSVWCVCGFSMSWTDEQRTKKLNQRKLLPVDPFDTTTYNYWTSWHDNFKCAAGEDYWELRQSAILHSLNNPRPVFREALRQFIWKRRFRQLIMDAELTLRHKFVFRWYPAITESLRTLVWRRRRFHRKLLDDYRTAFVVRTARREAAMLKPVLIKFVWFCRFRNTVLGSLLRRFYCLSKGWGDLTEEQLEVEEDQLAMFSIGLN